MFGVLFVDVVCWLDEVKVEDVFFSLKFVTATWFYFNKREKNFLLITNIVFFKTSETFDFIVVWFQAPEIFDFIVFNVALRFFIIALHLESGVKTKGESSYIFLLSNKKMGNNKNIIFSAAVRGSHVYKASWKPNEDELLECSYEKDNPFDSFLKYSNQIPLLKL